MIACALAVLGSNLAMQDRPKTFTDREMGVQFDYPANWTLRNERFLSRLTIPLGEGRTAEVQIIRTPFRQPADAWQKAQSDIAESLGRSVVRQWEEIILSVPLLMTELGPEPRGSGQKTLVGLLYALRAEKFGFRLNAMPDDYPTAQAAWREVLNSLRTTDGQLPATERPGQALPDARPVEEGPKITVLRPDDPSRLPVRPARGLRPTPLEALGLNLTLHMPRGWEVRVEGSSRTLVHSRLASPAVLELGAGSFDDLRRSMLLSSSRTAGVFEAVSLREEVERNPNRSGARRFVIGRVGRTAEGERAVRSIGAQAGTLWWVVRIEGAPGRAWDRQAALVDDLMNSMLITGP
ncbi:MAG: hypothetical protein MH204_09775 [Fimbriimonadaceae bacterium]|nr:hypothetical protein [Fimbriimonadaceae bacterium]